MHKFETKTRIMKKFFMFVMAIIIIASFLLTKTNRKERMSDIALANVEALAQTEKMEDGYYCYGTGSVVCPYSGELVGGYYKRRNIE